MGGLAWGRPDTDKLPRADGTGRFNRFNPVVGIGIAAVLGPLIQNFISGIGKAVNGLFGFGDDVVGSQTITLTGKDLLILASKAGNSTIKNVGFKFATNNLLGQHANYKVYFGIVPV